MEIRNCDKEFIEYCFKVIEEAPDSQISKQIKEEMKSFTGTITEKYYKLAEISKRPCCEISRFMSSLCALDLWYLPPEE